MTRHEKESSEIIPRENLDFDLQSDDIPRFWFAGDPFKTRFFDAMSTLFPEGEKFFIACVRDFRDQIKDAELKDQVRQFMRQEGQHGMVHTQFNDRLKAQGIDVDAIEQGSRDILFGIFRKRFSARRTLAQTAASEHMTAIMAHSFFERRIFNGADHRIAAMYAWHGVEEIEHKAVAFDVMRDVAGVGYWLRCAVMLYVTILFPLHVFLVMRHMFDVDGFRGWKRLKLWAKGLWWLYRPGGLYMPLLGHYLAYYKPGFHPWDSGRMQAYEDWRQAFDASGDPVVAGKAALETAA